jgi:hypothetical protein
MTAESDQRIADELLRVAQRLDEVAHNLARALDALGLAYESTATGRAAAVPPLVMRALQQGDDGLAVRELARIDASTEDEAAARLAPVKADQGLGPLDWP